MDSPKPYLTAKRRNDVQKQAYDLCAKFAAAEDADSFAKVATLIEKMYQGGVKPERKRGEKTTESAEVGRPVTLDRRKQAIQERLAAARATRK